MGASVMDLEKLKQAVQGQVFNDEETLREVETDFGRIRRKRPQAVVVPSSAEDVVQVIRLANQEGWSVSTRGSGHSQSGQSLNEQGVLLDMTGLSRIGPLEGESIQVEAGVLWSDLLVPCLEQGLVPPVLTNNLNVTVGGTLSMAGLGVASHRYGTQADNVLELEVVTGEGHRVTCSPEKNAELFHCTRCGLGQFSVITRARLKLRKAAPRTRTFYLLYDRLETLLKDQERILSGQRFDFVEAWCSPCPQGLKGMGETRVPFAEWFFPVHLTVEYEGAPPPDTKLLGGLHYFRKVHEEENSLQEFLHRMEPAFALWKQSGTWNFTHPWMEVVLPWDHAASYIQGVLKNFPPHLLVGGHVLLWPCRGNLQTAPLFKYPPGERVMGFGLLPAVPSQTVPLVLPLLNKASDLAMQIGGKRYLSGWVDFDTKRWKAHFGEDWTRLLKWKRFYDPRGILNPGFIRFEDSKPSGMPPRSDGG